MTQPVQAQDEQRNFLVERDVTFLAEGREEKMDLYLPPDPKGEEKRPAVVIIHGGGWRMGDKADEREKQIATALANAGYVCASINYQLITNEKPSWPQCLLDCQQAVRFLRDRADEYAIDPKRIGAIGGSAGGNLSLLIGLSSKEGNFEGVQAIVALYPPTDMLRRKNDNVALFGSSSVDRPDLYKSASPLHLVGEKFPPTLLIHGTADAVVPHEHSEWLDKRLTELKVPHKLILLEDMPHTFKLKEVRQDLRPNVVEFFNEHLGFNTKKP